MLIEFHVWAMLLSGIGLALVGAVKGKNPLNT